MTISGQESGTEGIVAFHRPYALFACSIPNLDSLRAGSQDGYVIRAERDGASIRAMAGMNERRDATAFTFFHIQIQGMNFKAVVMKQRQKLLKRFGRKKPDLLDKFIRECLKMELMTSGIPINIRS